MNMDQGHQNGYDYLKLHKSFVRGFKQHSTKHQLYLCCCRKHANYLPLINAKVSLLVGRTTKYLVRPNWFNSLTGVGEGGGGDHCISNNHIHLKFQVLSPLFYLSFLSALRHLKFNHYFDKCPQWKIDRQKTIISTQDFSPKQKQNIHNFWSQYFKSQVSDWLLKLISFMCFYVKGYYAYKILEFWRAVHFCEYPLQLMIDWLINWLIDRSLYHFNISP